MLAEATIRIWIQIYKILRYFFDHKMANGLPLILFLVTRWVCAPLHYNAQIVVLLAHLVTSILIKKDVKFDAKLTQDPDILYI